MYIFCNNYSEKLSEFRIHDDFLIKHFCAHKLYTTVKVNSAVHYKSMQLLMRKKTSYIAFTFHKTAATVGLETKPTLADSGGDSKRNRSK